jgi:hypothetical protein
MTKLMRFAMISREPLITFLLKHFFDRFGTHLTDADNGLPATAPRGTPL